MNKSIYIDPTAISIILFCFVVLFFIIRRRIMVYERSAQLTIPYRISSGAIEIPLLESYGGIKGLGLLSLSDNSISPKLILHDSWMDYRVLVSKTADYAQIEHVRGITFLFARIILFTFRDRTMTFGARVANLETLKKLLDFFRNNGVEVHSRY
jgi:hypothetical protein